MIERSYNPSTGQIIGQGATPQRSQATYDVRGGSTIPPGGVPVYRQGPTFHPDSDWTPSDAEQDPHDDAFDDGDYEDAAPVPDNIVGDN